MTLRSWPDGTIIDLGGLQTTSLQHSSPFHVSTTLFPNTSLQNSSPTLLHKILLQHFSAPLFCNTSLQHSSPTLLYSSPSKSLHHSSQAPQQFSPIPSKTSLQHLLQDFCRTRFPRYLYCSLLQHFSTTIFWHTSLLQHTPPTLWTRASTLLQHFSITLFSNTSLQSFPTLLQNTLLANHRVHMNPNVNTHISFFQQV